MPNRAMGVVAVTATGYRHRAFRARQRNKKNGQEFVSGSEGHRVKAHSMPPQSGPASPTVPNSERTRLQQVLHKGLAFCE